MTLFIPNVNKQNRAFTLIELMLVIVLITIVYSIFIPKFISSNATKKVITLENLSQSLTNRFSFESSLVFRCFEDTNECFVFLDGSKSDLEFKEFFETKPLVYDLNFNLIEFDSFEVAPLDEKDVSFELVIDHDYKFRDMIVEVDEKVFYFNSIKKNAIKFKNMDFLKDTFEKRKDEVLDAF